MPDTQTQENITTTPAQSIEQPAAQFVPTEIHTQTEGVKSAGNEEDVVAEAAKEHGLAPANLQALKTETPPQAKLPELNLDGNVNPNMTNFMEYKKAKLENEIVDRNLNEEDKHAA